MTGSLNALLLDDVSIRVEGITFLLRIITLQNFIPLIKLVLLLIIDLVLLLSQILERLYNLVAL